MVIELPLIGPNTRTSPTPTFCVTGIVIVGASFTACTVTVREAAAFFTSWSSRTWNEIMRIAVLGLSLEFRYLTLRSTVWYWAGVAVPDRRNSPVAAVNVPVMPPLFVQVSESSPETKLLEIQTLALYRLVLSASLRVNAPSIVTAGAFST